MSTFLELAVKLRQEVGGAGTGPTAVTGQVGEYKRIVDWVAAADEEVQRKYDDWLFMVGSFTIDTVADDGKYAAADCVTPITDLRKWKNESFKIYLSATGVSDETPLTYIDYQRWYEIYNTGTQTSGRPQYFTIDDDNSVLLAPKPSAVYRVSGKYHKSVDTLAASSDTPVYPAEFHMLAVYGAMMKYGRYTGATEVYADGQRLHKEMLAQMSRTQRPRIRPLEPMA
jgi:hypothetical protein